MNKKYALSSMALLGLTRAQLWIERSKTFTVHSVTPMNRLLTLVDSGNDDLVVRLDCVNDETDATEIGPYEYYFNDVQRDDIGKRFCPAGTAGDVNRASLDVGDDWKTNCYGSLNDMPVFDNGGMPWVEPSGALTCAPDHQLNIMIYNRYEPDISMTYNLDTWQYACIEDDYLSIFFEFGKRETFEGKDLCFSNEEYIPEWYDPPFVVNNNCYGPGGEGTSANRPGYDYWECHTEGYRVDLHVLDNEEANEYYGKYRKIREPYMWVQVDFHRVKDYFQIFPEDKARISFWKGQDENPRSVTISPAEDMQNVCDPYRAADEIICENLSVFCTSPDDTVNLRIAAAGEILIYDTSNTCGEIVSGAFDYNTMNAALVDDPDLYDAHLGESFLYHVEVNDHEEGAYSNAWFSFAYGTYHRSNEEICFTGDFFPYQSPSCYLQNSGLPVATQIHNPHEYAMDAFVMEIVLNSDYLPFYETEPQVFEVGGEVDLTNQLTSAIQGYVDLDKLDDAVATSITIESLPACGALYRETVSEDEEQFAIFWTYNNVQGFVVQAAVGDTIDFGITSLFYDGQEDCEALEDEFTYSVMGSIPVEGPTTSTGLQVVETLHAYGAFGLEPSVANGPVMFTLGGEDGSDVAPFGAEVGRCSSQTCDDPSDPEILEYGVEYDYYEGWYYVQTTAESYNSRGEVRDLLRHWMYYAFCDAIPGCGEEEPDIVSYQGIARHPDSSYIVNFGPGEDFQAQMSDFITMYYCPQQCYDMSAPGWSVDGYNGLLPVELVQYDTDYDIGSGGMNGQFLFQQNANQVAHIMAQTEEELTAMYVGFEQFMYSYFNWFGTSEFLPDGYGVDYTFADVVQQYVIPSIEDESAEFTIIFNEYPPKGWLGVCEYEGCMIDANTAEVPTQIILGYEYNVQLYDFIMYITYDGWDYDAEMPIESVVTWVESYFTYLVSTEPAAPAADAMIDILAAIGAPAADLTVTLLYNAPVDLDLHFSCDDGSQIYYGNTNNDACLGTLDMDQQADLYNNVRGDGSQGQIENISVGSGADGHTYAGKVVYYSGSGNAPFQLVFSGVDGDGVRHVFGQQYVETFDSAGSEHPYSYSYTAL